MTRFADLLRKPVRLSCTLLMLFGELWRFLLLCPSAALAAENLFLRKPLALNQERHVQPKRATNTARIALIWLAHWFDRRPALARGATGDLAPLASPGISPVLAVEITTRTSPDPS